MRRSGGVIFIAVCVALASGWLVGAAAAGGYRVTQVWGETGEARGQLQVPKGAAVAADGSVWVVDYHNQTLLKYSAAGELLGCWGGLGGAPGQFRQPSRVAVGPDGTVYVTDAGNQRIQCFSQSGAFLRQFGRPGTGPGEFAFPRGLGIGPDGAVYVTDQNNQRVQVFTPRGEYVRQWGSRGEGRGQFGLPKDVAVSADGRVYVVDARTGKVQIFTARGRWLGSFGGRGSARGRLSGPRGLDVDARGHVFVADAMNHRIQEFTGSGAFVREWGCKGSLDGLLLGPRDVTAAPDGTLVVVDTYNHRLQRFVKDGAADDRPPSTDCDARAGWSATPLNLVLTAEDRGSGVAATYAGVDGLRFRLVDGPVALGRQGRHVVRYLSVDAAGNQERTRQRVFRLDWGAPHVRFRPRRELRVVAGAPVRSFCIVADRYSRTCRVWLRIDRGDEPVLRRDLGRAPASAAGRLLSASFRAPRRVGRYELIVITRDLAGNTGRQQVDLLVRRR